MTILVRNLFKLISWGLILLFLLFIWFKFLRPTPEFPTTVIDQTLVLQEITRLGKLELVKYQFKDVVEYQKEQTQYQTFNQFLPSAKTVLIVKGEAVGCIDLAKMKESDIVIQEETISLFLPDPEICYFKVDHQHSRVYDVSNGYFVDEGQMVNDAFKAAEIQLRQSAIGSGILQETKETAQAMLAPFLAKIASKKVVFQWKQSAPKK